MRRILLLFLTFVLTACIAPATPIIISPEELAEPTQTPEIILQTVIVTVIVTSIPPEISSTTVTPLPLSTQVRATGADKAQQSSSLATSLVVTATGSRMVTLASGLGGDFFPTITLSGKTLSLRCAANKQITFKVTPSNPRIAKVDFYHRIEDRGTGLIFDWEGPRRMTSGANGTFTLVLTGEDIKPDFRYPNAWLDFQFVGLSESGGRIGNSEKISRQVNFTVDCP